MALPCIIRAASEGKGRTGPTLAQSARISNRARVGATDEAVISPDAVDKSWTPSYLSTDLPARCSDIGSCASAPPKSATM